MTRIGVLALQGDFAEHIAILTRLGVEGRQVRLPKDLAGLDGLIIPGGESTTIGRLMADYGLLEPIRALTTGGFPTWGTCAGLILLAREATEPDVSALTAMDIVVERNAYGRQVDSFEAELDVPALGSPPFRAVFIRAPIVREVGPQVEVLARLDGGMPVAVRQGHLLATAFHPELTDDLRFHEYFLRMAEETQKLKAREAPSAGGGH
jgi:5'-phosphate synthase pdxT subunit